MQNYSYLLVDRSSPQSRISYFLSCRLIRNNWNDLTSAQDAQASGQTRERPCIKFNVLWSYFFLLFWAYLDWFAPSCTAKHPFFFKDSQLCCTSTRDSIEIKRDKSQAHGRVQAHDDELIERHVLYCCLTATTYSMIMVRTCKHFLQGLALSPFTL